MPNALQKQLVTPIPKTGVLIASHFLADFFSSLLPGVLPVILAYFQLPLQTGIIVVAFMGIGANFLQIPAAALDQSRRTPRILALGLILASLVLCIGILPQETPAGILALLMLCIGCGVALVHPHGLRGTQIVSAVPATVMTPAFMAGGFAGAAFAPWCGAALVENFGLQGLLVLTIPLFGVLAAIYLCHIRLAVDPPTAKKPEVPTQNRSPWSFRSLFWIALLMNTGTTIYQTLLSTHLNTLGLPLTAGGVSLMLFGIGSAIGSMTIGVWIRKRSVSPLFFQEMTIGILLLAIYLRFPTLPGAYFLSFFAGMTASGQYPILVSLARSASCSGMDLGRRMAWIVGGTWGIANLLFAGIGQLTRWTTLTRVIQLSWVFYAAALLTALLCLKPSKNR